MSQAAARVAGHFEEMETQLAENAHRINKLENQLELAKEQLALTKAELTRTLNKLDYFQSRFIEVRTKLQTAGNIILDALKESPTDAEQGDKEAYRAVEQAITGLQSTADKG